MKKARPSVDWSTVVMTGPPEPIGNLRDALDEGPGASVMRLVPDVLRDSLQRSRGRSPLKNLLSGASMRARSNGARFTHARICRRLRPGFDVLIYGVGLFAAVLVNNHEGRLDRLAFVIGDASDRMERL